MSRACRHKSAQELQDDKEFRKLREPLRPFAMRLDLSTSEELRQYKDIKTHRMVRVTYAGTVSEELKAGKLLSRAESDWGVHEHGIDRDTWADKKAGDSRPVGSVERHWMRNNAGQLRRAEAYAVRPSVTKSGARGVRAQCDEVALAQALKELEDCDSKRRKAS